MTVFEPLGASEMNACIEGLKTHDDWASYIANNGRDIVVQVFSSFCRARFGEAEGTTAYQRRTGKSAIRYYDREFNQLRWLIMDKADSPSLTGQRVDELVATYGAWTVNEYPWDDLVRKGFA